MTNALVRNLHRTFATLAAAARAASAVEARRMPSEGDLKKLEIEPRVFRGIDL
jgi:hypothetical protein